MNWVANSLQLAENLLESVDNKAALRLNEQTNSNERYISRQSRLEVEEKSKPQLKDKNDPEEISSVDIASTNAKKSEKAFIRQNANHPDQTCESDLIKEVDQLNSELNTLDKQMMATQTRLEFTLDELKALEKEYHDKVVELNEEIQDLKSAKVDQEQEFLQALETKDKYILNSENEIAKFTKEISMLNAEIEKLKSHLASEANQREQFWSNAATSNQKTETLELLRAQLEKAESRIASMKEEAAANQKVARDRHHHLEETNTTLNNALATLQRQLEMKSSLPQNNELTSNDMDDRIRILEESLAFSKDCEEREKNKNGALRTQIDTLTKELATCRYENENLQKVYSAQLQESKSRITELEKELHNCASKEPNDQLSSEYQQQLKVMAQKVMEKQEQVDRTISKMGALQARLDGAHKRAIDAENQLHRMEHRNFGDIERGPNSVRSNTKILSIAQWPPIARRPQLARIVRTIDGFAFRSVTFLRGNSLARLGALAYFLLIHVWVFLILGFHTSHLAEEVNNDGGVVMPGA